MKNNKREMLLTSLVCLLPLFAGAALYPRLPETMATHWDFSGNANGWSSRAATVFGLPLFILALHLVCFYAESRETKKNRNPVLRSPSAQGWAMRCPSAPWYRCSWDCCS